ncbi:MAG TPA: mandelate racemase/muconate lactonizing enzyme family protein [Acetobacteraceae bacterium]|nr:mandelate racemase/muconate lactonizing enzyme family protein [Acetobacteraceae bacterium]
MKITGFQADMLSIPEDDPLANSPSPERDPMRPIVTLRLRTDQGIEGIGLSFFAGRLTRALREAVAALCEVATGMDPLRPEALIAAFHDAAGGSDPGGIFTLACAAIDLALWDIKGKTLGQPVWKLLGGTRNRVPTYASGSLRRGLTDERAETAAKRLLAKGFTEMKMQLALPGRPTISDELRRARIVREAIGPDIRLMCDINQRWRPEQAIDIGRKLEDIGFFWLEDVTAADDYAGLARVSQALATPIAGGEYLWGIVPFRHMIEARSVDVVMIDLVRVGGVTPWIKVAAMAQAFNLPVVSHLVPEFHAHLIAAIPNGLTVEYMPWMVKLFREVPPIEKGEIALTDAPGFGLAFDEAAFARFRTG